jgi:hypothetical protein
VISLQKEFDVATYEKGTGDENQNSAVLRRRLCIKS